MNEPVRSWPVSAYTPCSRSTCPTPSKMRPPGRNHRVLADRPSAGERPPRGIARAQFHLRRIDAEFLRHELGKHRLVSLPGRTGEHIDRRIAGLTELDRRLLLAHGGAARGLDEDGAADAAQLAAAPRVVAPAGVAIPVRGLERALDVS